MPDDQLTHPTPEVARFVGAAKRYCAIIESLAQYSLAERLRRLATAVAELYAAASQLPECEPSEGYDTSAAWAAWFDVPELPSLEPFEQYWEVFDPYQLDEPVAGTLSNALQEIYGAVARSLLILEGGAESVTDAIWDSRFQFVCRWGHHATDALRAINAALEELEFEN